MTPKQRRTVSVSRERYSVYLKKSREFFESMESALRVGNWDAAGLNAVHCAISAADALLVYFAGVRSSGEHNDVVGLLELHVRNADVGPKTKSLVKILNAKNLAAYEDRELTESEARELAKLTQRFYDWAKGLLV